MAEMAAPMALAMQVTGQLVGGIEENRAARAQASIDEANAQRTLLQGEQQVLQTRREERRVSGDMLAGMGGSGLLIGGGSAADVLEGNAYQRELEILNIRSQTATQANNLYQGAADRRQAGRAAFVRSVFGAASGALAGAADLRRRRIEANAQDTYRSAVLGGGIDATPAPPMRVSGGG